MKFPKLLLLTLLLLPASSTQGQFMYKFLFKGTAYWTNATGNVVATPITEQSLLEDRARRGGITDLSTVAIVYHVNGDGKGDTVKIVDATTGANLAFQFGFWFGSEASLQRSALTNATGTEVRRVDYIYTLEDSTFTSGTSHSVGAAFVTKRFVTATNGAVHRSIEGPIHWIVNPHGQTTNGPVVCSGNFIIGTPLF
ncbi:MAG TPA: hypothetical protein VN673_06960 [Clostridia bacterium]|nr:hypothetical protein [Clostridia bacterium]